MRNILSLLVFVVFTLFTNAQGLIINEFSNGPSGTKEWLELVVIGDSNNPMATVDLTGWIIDDNGGNFDSGSGIGLADGHIKLTNAFNAVPVGSILVLYNETDKNANIPADDPLDLNNDSIYIIPGNHSSLEMCQSLPSASSFSYSCTPTSPVQWSVVGLRNGGDALQVRTPGNVMYHGFSYGDVSTPFPTFPSGTSSWNIGAGSTTLAYAFTCGFWENQASFNEINETVSTPGAVNGAQNNRFISRLRNGTFNYSDLTANCNPIVINPPVVNPPVVDLPEIIIPNVFSPNGDGLNDFFTIDSLKTYPTKNLAIYNRWGNKVFEENNYQNMWDGRTNGGSKLSEGTYYYILDLGDESKARTGFLNLFE